MPTPEINRVAALLSPATPERCRLWIGHMHNQTPHHTLTDWRGRKRLTSVRLYIWWKSRGTLPLDAAGKPLKLKPTCGRAACLTHIQPVQTPLEAAQSRQAAGAAPEPRDATLLARAAYRRVMASAELLRAARATATGPNGVIGVTWDYGVTEAAARHILGQTGDRRLYALERPTSATRTD